MSTESQQRIIDASARIFAEEGYHHATIANICSEAGISNGALYKYFKNKESLFFTVVDYCTSRVEQLYKKNYTESHSIYEAISKYLNDLAVFATENRLYICIYSDLGSSSMNRFASVTAEKFRNATSLYTIKMVNSAKIRGEIKNSIDTEKAAYLIDTYITVFSYSLVSEYQKIRFHSFFPNYSGDISTDEMINLLVATMRQVFQS